MTTTRSHLPQIIALRRSGRTLAEIAKQLDCCTATVHYHLNYARRQSARGRGLDGKPLSLDDIAAATTAGGRKPDTAPPDPRRDRLATLHPLLREAVLAATGSGAVEGWVEED